jgi:hypothetical protein
MTQVEGACNNLIVDRYPEIAGILVELMTKMSTAAMLQEEFDSSIEIDQAVNAIVSVILTF